MKKLLLLIPALFLLSCGPVYKTYYDYKAPRSADGRICASQCLQSKSYCVENCKLRVQQCNIQNQYSYDNYDYYGKGNVVRPKDKARGRSRSGVVANYNPSCSNAGCEESCQDEYNGCYSVCGGEINSRVVCVAGCQQ